MCQDIEEKIKTCTRCKTPKVFSEFTLLKDEKPYSHCRKCVAEKTKIWTAKNKTKVAESLREYQKKNAVKLAIYRAQYYQEHKEETIKRSGDHYKRRYQEDPHFRVEMQVRKRIRHLLTSTGRNKRTKSMELIGIDKQGLIRHLESLFLPGMSWMNYGYRGWHVDHIKPCSSFDLTDPEQQKACFHYTNLQPLWGIDNMKKSDKTQ